MYEQDWIMRQIQMLVRFIAKLIYGKDTVEYQVTEAAEQGDMSETDLLFYEIERLLADSKICEAEDLLFDRLNISKKYLELAVDFYQKINEFSDDDLENANFSREEIQSGLKEIMKIFGLSDLV